MKKIKASNADKNSRMEAGKETKSALKTWKNKDKNGVLGSNCCHIN